MGDKTWKRAERVVARMFGTTRQPGSGSYRTRENKETGSDTKHPTLYIEVKYRKNVPQFRLLEEAHKANPYNRCCVTLMTGEDTFFVAYLDDLVQVAALDPPFLRHFRQCGTYKQADSAVSIYKAEVEAQSVQEGKQPLLILREKHKRKSVCLIPYDKIDAVIGEMAAWSGPTDDDE